MKVLILCVFVALAAANPPQQYSGKYDNIDLVKVLKNERLLKRYIDCLMDAPKCICDKDGSYLKEKLPEALRTDCALCTNKQKIGAFKAISYLILHKPQIWKKVQARFDPKNVFLTRNRRQLEYIQQHTDETFVEKEFLALFSKHHGY